MSSMISTTAQAALLSAVSSILAQGISAFQNNRPFVLDLTSLLQFVIWAIISTPPNVYWQDFLEEKFPSTTSNEKGEKTLNKRNTAKKFALDQTIGSVLNNAGFIAGMGALRGHDSATIQKAMTNDLLPIIMSSWSVWPAVSLLNFTVVPPSKRIIVGSLVGLFWGVYIALIA